MSRVPEPTSGTPRSPTLEGSAPSPSWPDMDLGLRLALCEAEAALFGTTEIDRAESRPPPMSEPWPAFGRYVLCRRIGVGGMGAVFEAYDPVLDRRVALKILHADLPGRSHERLRREALALARLHHPHVVEVYEIGRAGDQIFITMELVRGQTLERWQQQSPPPSWREHVRLYLQAGEGLAAAHAAGMVHRDFKPSNCMLGDDGRVRVLDFGLAAELRGFEVDPSEGSRAGGDLLATKASGLVGTPAFMPLEQLRGQPVDARADQYAFCASLHQAVYGQLPFAARTFEALAHALERGEIHPPPPGRAVPAALRRILLRGLARDPQDRWAGMEPLLVELRRLLAPRRGARVTLVASGTLAVLSAAAWWGLAEPGAVPPACSGPSPVLDTWGAPQRDRVEAAIRATELPHAHATWERVERGLDVYAEGWASAHAEICEATHVRGEPSAEVTDLRMGCLRDRLVALRELVDVLAEATPTRVEHAVEMVAGLPALSRCDDVEALRADVPPPEDPRAAARVAALREQLARVDSLEKAGEYDEASALAHGVATEAEALGYAPLQAEARLLQAVIHERTGRYDEAARGLESTYLVAVEAGHAVVAMRAAAMLALVVGYHQARHEEGQRWGRAALVLAQGPRGDALLESQALNALGAVSIAEGNPAEAVRQLRQALALQEEVLGREHVVVARMLSNLGMVLHAQGNVTDAVALLQRSLAIQEASLGPLHPKVATTLTNLGNALGSRGDWGAALEHHRRALAIEEQSLGPDHPSVGESLLNVGNALSHRGERDAALEHLRRASAIFEAALGPHDPRVARALLNIAAVLGAKGHRPQAFEHLRRSISIFEDAHGSRHPTVASALSNLGLLLLAQGDLAKAREHLQRSLEIKEEALGPRHPDVVYTLVGLAEVALGQHEPEAARAYAERALSICEAAEVAPPLLAEARLGLAKALWSTPAERPRALALARQARDAYTMLGPAYATDLEAARAWLAAHAAP